MIDEIDGLILELLQKDARTSNASIARQLGMAPSAIFERIRKLEQRGIIEGYQVRLNARDLGYGLLAFIFVRTDERVGSFGAAEDLANIPEVQEVYNVAGEDCYLVKVRCGGTEALGRLIRERIGAIACVRSTRTTIVLNVMKEHGTLPVGRSSQTSPASSSPRKRESI